MENKSLPSLYNLISHRRNFSLTQAPRKFAENSRMEQMARLLRQNLQFRKSKPKPENTPYDMSRFDRYILSQSFVVFGFFTIIFLAVIWINRAIKLFDRLIADGHSVGIFFEFSALTLPGAMAEIIPLSAFATSVYITNRLSSESELVVMQATGFSPWRMARPFVIFGTVTAVFVANLTLVLVPMAADQQRVRQADIAANVSSKLLRSGVFQHPIAGVTFFIREITDTGELVDVYISDRRSQAQFVTYTASRAYLVQQDDETLFVMINGMAQTYDRAQDSVSLTQFGDLTYGIGDILAPQVPAAQKAKHLTIWQFSPSINYVAQRTGETLARVSEEYHSRLAAPVLVLATTILGFVTIYIAGFSRFGSGRYIVFAIFLLVIIKAIESAIADPTRQYAQLWYLTYTPAFFGLFCSWILITINDSGLLKKRRKNMQRAS